MVSRLAKRELADRPVMDTLECLDVVRIDINGLIEKLPGPFVLSQVGVETTELIEPYGFLIGLRLGFLD